MKKSNTNQTPQTISTPVRFTTTASILTAITFTTATAGYWLTSSALGHTFGGMFRMFMYHEEYPFQYVAIIAVMFGLIGSIWSQLFRESAGWKRFTTIALAILVTIIAASIPGGILWVIHDMQAGYFTKGARFWGDIWWGAKTGLSIGWLLILFSLPYNLLGLPIGVIFLHKLPEIERCILSALRRPRAKTAGPR